MPEQRVMKKVKSFRCWIFIILVGYICLEVCRMIKVKIFRSWISFFLDGYICLERRRNRKSEKFSMLNFFLLAGLICLEQRRYDKNSKVFDAELLFSWTGIFEAEFNIPGLIICLERRRNVQSKNLSKLNF